MSRRLLVSFLSTLALAMLFASAASSQSVGTFTFGTLPGSPTPGQLAWITDNSGTPTAGSPAAGGAAPGNRDLVAYDATQTRWEFVTRVPATVPAADLETYLDAVRVAYDNSTSGLDADEVQAAIDELAAEGGGGGGATDLSTSATGSLLQINSSTGADASIPAATGSTWGALTDEDKAKLDGIAPLADERDAVQPIPSTATDTKANAASITNPSATSFGYGISFAAPDAFNDALRYPGGPAGLEADNQVGFYYNFPGVANTSVIDQYEHALNDSWELSYRAAGTGHETWFEKNLDLYAPVNSASLSGVTGTFAAGDVISFSGGGSGKVRTWSGGILTWAHNYGTTAAGQTVTNITQSGGGTLGTVTYQGLNNWLRALQMEWDTVDNTVFWAFQTVRGAAAPTLRMFDGNVGINSNTPIAGFLQVETRSGAKAAIRAEYIYDESHSGSVGFAVTHRANFSAANSVNDLLDYKGFSFESPTSPPNVNNVFRYAAVEFADQRGPAGTDAATIRFKPQTCSGIACTGPNWGNVEFQGGNWNNGHLTFGGTSPYDADHFWRDQTNNRYRVKTGSGPTTETDGNLIAEVIQSGSRALATAAIASGACSTADTGISATGVATTDVVSWSFNGDVTAVTGYAPVTTGALSIYAYPTAGGVNFKVCNPTASSITPGAVTLNWRVVR